MPPKSKLTLDVKLNQFKISHEFYNAIRTELSSYGYSDVDIEKMILRNGKYLEIYKSLIRHHQTLQDLKFTHMQIVRMVSHNGGSKNLEAVTENLKLL